jgi:hypothetical protein
MLTKKTNQHYKIPILKLLKEAIAKLISPKPSAVSYADKRKGSRSLGPALRDDPALLEKA